MNARTRDRIAYGIPDVLGDDRDRYAGRRVLVVGCGHSAFNAILDLVTLRGSEPGTEIVWAIRGGAPGRKYGGGGDDELPARGALGAAVRGLVADGSVELVGGFQTREVLELDGRLALADGERTIVGRRGDRGDRASGPTCACSASCGSTSTIASRRPVRSLR